jgi:hypothetical protein
MSTIKLNPTLKDRYDVGRKVTAGKFEHRYLGVVDLETIHEAMAEKLVKTGHLIKKKGTPEKGGKDKG